MKKFTFALMLAAVALFVASPLFAEGMMFGVKGGLNMANITGDNTEGTSMKMGGVGGVFMCYKITEIFAIQPEIFFSMKGTKMDFVEEIDGEDVTIETSMKLNYIEIPLLFKVNLPTEGAIKPMLYAGPALGILMTAKVSGEAEGVSVDVDIKDEVKSTDIGILAGAGVGYQMENGGMLSLEARYEIGMTSIDNSAAADNVKNGVISIMVGYGFAF